MIAYISRYVIALRKDERGRRESIVRISKEEYLIYTIIIRLVVENRSIGRTTVLF